MCEQHEDPENNEQPKTFPFPWLLVLPTVTGVLVGPQVAEGRLSAFFDVEAPSFGALIVDWGLGVALGGLVGALVGSLLERMFLTPENSEED